MVKITINGKKSEREFPNMAHALAFAYQNGECYVAKKLELAYAATEEAVKESGQKQAETTAGVDSTDQTGDGSASGTGEAGKEAGVDSTDQAV